MRNKLKGNLSSHKKEVLALSLEVRLEESIIDRPVLL